MPHCHRIEHRDGKIVKITVKSGAKIKRGRVGNWKSGNLRSSTKKTKRKVLPFLPTNKATNSATFLEQADRQQKAAAEIRARERQQAAAHLRQRGNMVQINKDELKRLRQVDDDYGSLEQERDKLQEELDKAKETIEDLCKQLGQKDVAIANIRTKTCSG